MNKFLLLSLLTLSGCDHLSTTKIHESNLVKKFEGLDRLTYYKNKEGICFALPSKGADSSVYIMVVDCKVVGM
jgi:hypothetical protein